jgi:hypothetical protein
VIGVVGEADGGHSGEPFMPSFWWQTGGGKHRLVTTGFADAAGDPLLCNGKPTRDLFASHRNAAAACCREPRHHALRTMRVEITGPYVGSVNDDS